MYGGSHHVSLQHVFFYFFFLISPCLIEARIQRMLSGSNTFFFLLSYCQSDQHCCSVFKEVQIKTRWKQTFKSWQHQSFVSSWINTIRVIFFKQTFCFVCVSAGIWSPEDNSHRPGPWSTKRHRLHNCLRSESQSINLTSTAKREKSNMSYHNPTAIIDKYHQAQQSIAAENRFARESPVGPFCCSIFRFVSLTNWPSAQKLFNNLSCIITFVMLDMPFKGLMYWSTVICV